MKRTFEQTLDLEINSIPKNNINNDINLEINCKILNECIHKNNDLQNIELNDSNSILSINVDTIRNNFFKKIIFIMSSRTNSKFHFETISYMRLNRYIKYCMDGPSARWINILFLDSIIHFCAVDDSIDGYRQCSRKSIEQRQIFYDITFETIIEEITSKMLSGVLIDKKLPDKLNIVNNGENKSIMDFLDNLNDSNIFNSGKTKPIFDQMYKIYIDIFNNFELDLNKMIIYNIDWIYNNRIKNNRGIVKEPIMINIDFLNELVNYRGLVNS